MGLIMINSKSIYIFLGSLLFIALPLLLFILGDFPKRDSLKEFISIVTILAFFIMIAQFYLSRLNDDLIKTFKSFKVIKIHKIFGYTILPILLIHPFLIVVPRFFEVGPNPFDSFILMITSFDKLGIFLGVFAWILILVLGLTSMFRNKLKISYKAWKIFHGVLSLIFILFAAWHTIEMGRHMSTSMISLIIVLILLASILLLKNYFFNKTIKGA